MLFVPVSGMVPPIRIRFMPEVGCDFVLWDDGNAHLGELEDLLPLPEDLREAVKAWADRHFRFDGGSLRLSADEAEQLLVDGERLSRQLQDALGPDYEVAPRF